MDHYAYLCALVALAFSLQALWCQLVTFFCVIVSKSFCILVS